MQHTQKQGCAISFFKNGTVSDITYYKNGEKSGISKQYNIDGTLKSFKYIDDKTQHSADQFIETYEYGENVKWEYIRAKSPTPITHNYTEYYNNLGALCTIMGGKELFFQRQEMAHLNLHTFKHIVRHDKMLDKKARTALNTQLKALRQIGAFTTAIATAQTFYATPHPVSGHYRRTALKCLPRQRG